MNNISGAIICGGLSKRMERDKALLKIEGITFIERAVKLIGAFTDSIMIIGRNEKIKWGKNHYFMDIFSSHGVMGGIHTALSYSTRDFVICLPIDMPLLAKEIIYLLIEKKGGKNKMRVFSKNGKIEPLPGLYSKSILPDLERILSKKKDDSMQRWIKTNNRNVFGIIEFEALPKKLQREEYFMNINYPKDLKMARLFLRKAGA